MILPHLHPTYCLKKAKIPYGVGYPEDILNAVKYGVDMFDCVLPTRSGRTGLAFTSVGTIKIRNSKYSNDKTPLDPDWICEVCSNYSKAYLHHLQNLQKSQSVFLLNII